MTPAEEEATFIQLWQAGTETAEIPRQLGLKATTAQSRAHRLQQRGLIHPRPRDGAYPTQKAQVRPERPPSTVHSEPVQTSDTGAVQPFNTGPVQRLNALEQEVQGLRLLVQSVFDRLDHPPVQIPVQITALPPYPKGKAVRRNLWILEPIREELATRAAEWDIPPSQLVQEMLWKALREGK